MFSDDRNVLQNFGICWLWMEVDGYSFQRCYFGGEVLKKIKKNLIFEKIICFWHCLG
jgi:hypothetical protein